MSKSKCTKEFYRAFLQASSIRYSGLALSEVSPSELSHDSMSHRLRNKCFRPREIWEISERHLDKKSPCLLIGDDTVLAKTPSKKIDLVNYHYSGNQVDYKNLYC